MGCGVWHLRTLIWNGLLPYINSGKKIWLDVKDLEDFIAKNKTRNDP